MTNSSRVADRRSLVDIFLVVHARIVMGLDVAVSAEALSDVQFSIVAGPDRAIHFTGGAGIPLRTSIRSATGDGPRPRSA